MRRKYSPIVNWPLVNDVRAIPRSFGDRSEIFCRLIMSSRMNAFHPTIVLRVPIITICVFLCSCAGHGDDLFGSDLQGDPTPASSPSGTFSYSAVNGLSGLVIWSLDIDLSEGTLIYIDAQRIDDASATTDELARLDSLLLDAGFLSIEADYVPCCDWDYVTGTWTTDDASNTVSWSVDYEETPGSLMEISDLLDELRMRYFVDDQAS